jgi:hypothetical protein
MNRKRQSSEPGIADALGWYFVLLLLLIATGFGELAVAQIGPFQKPGAGDFGPMKPPGFGKSGDAAGPRAPVAYVDVHVHPVPTGPGGSVTASLDDELSAMDQAGMRMMVLMPTPQGGGGRALWDYASFLDAARRRPDRFAFLGGGDSLNLMIHETPADRVDDVVRQRFTERATRILSGGAAGFGELALHHLSLTAGHPYESIAADHPLLLLLSDIAAERGVVIDLHFDLVAFEMALPESLRNGSNPERLKENLTAFERLLEHNPRARIVWAHASSDPLGQWTPTVSRQLHAKHPNLYMSLRLSVPMSGMQNTLMAGGRIDPDWLAVVTAFSDRFLIGGDELFVSGAARGRPAVTFSMRAGQQRRLQAVVLTQLPPNLARTISYDNAMRLYKLRN